MCEVKERLDKCQTELLARGYEDVKFFFSPRSNKSLGEAGLEAAQVLEAILEKQYSDFKPFGDAAKR